MLDNEPLSSTKKKLFFAPNTTDDRRNKAIQQHITTDNTINQVMLAYTITLEASETPQFAHVKTFARIFLGFSGPRYS